MLRICNSNSLLRFMKIEISYCGTHHDYESSILNESQINQ